MNNKNSRIIGEQAALLSLIEMGLGSILHGLKIPLSGQFLSLNQIAFMSRTTRKLKSREAALQISLITSMLKSLSPAGKKLTPMLAILAQGCCFTLGPAVFGLNFVGIIFGSLLSALWAFIQPALFIYLLFGKALVDVLAHFNLEIKKVINIDLQQLIPWLMGFILIKCLLGIAAGLYAFYGNEEKLDLWQEKLLVQPRIKSNQKESTRSPFLLAIKDLCSPLFLFSFALTTLFFSYSHAEGARLIWILLRPLAIGFILFYIVRVYPIENLAVTFEKMGWRNFAENYRAAVILVRGRRGK